jgi:hypothetical protein
MLKKVNQSQSQARGAQQKVSRQLRFPDYVTAAQDGGKDVSLTQEILPVLISVRG